MSFQCQKSSCDGLISSGQMTLQKDIWTVLPSHWQTDMSPITSWNYLSFWTNWTSVAQTIKKWKLFEKRCHEKDDFFSVTTMNTLTTWNFRYRQTVWQKHLKLRYKKLQTIYNKREKRKNQNVDYERHTINLEYVSRNWRLCVRNIYIYYEKCNKK